MLLLRSFVLFSASCLLGAGGSLAASLDTEAEGPTVIVRAEQPRFDRLAAAVAAEIETLLQPEPKPWQTLYLDAAADLDAAGLDKVGSDGTASITVAVGVSPDAASATVVVRDAPHVLVDAVGWLDAAGSTPELRIASASRLEAVAAADLAAFRRLLEQVGGPLAAAPRILVLVDDWLLQAKPALLAAGRAAGVEVVLGGLDEAERDVAGCYLPPGHGLDVAAAAATLHARGVPTFSSQGRRGVELGALAARGRTELERLPRLAALQVLALVRELPAIIPAGRLDADDSSQTPLVVQLDAAETLGLDLPWRLELEAELLGERREHGDAQSIRLETARAEAVAANLGLRSRALTTAASEEDIRSALAALRPQLILSSLARSLDEDTSIAAFGSQPEQLMTATGEASWLLFSEDARAGVDGARLVQAARELELQELEKDIALESALALLAVAQARAFEAIERENLSLTYADLAAAESRRAAGTGSRADVARLRARISRDRQALVAAYEARRGAEIRFNRLLDRPLDQQILPVIDEAESAARQANDPAETLPLPLEATVRTPAAFDGLGAKLLTLAEAQAPEIAAAQRLLEAREREVLAARRAFYLPTAFASASLATRLAEGGVGREPPTPPGAEGLFPLPPDTSWSLGVGVELPILTGGARAARRARAELDRDATELLLDRARQQVEERLRLALLGLETAYETRLQAQRAAQAAEEAFEVVEDAYAQGLENLTTLLDAQRELRVARRSQAAATYAALARWHEVERATGGELDDAALSRIQSRLQEHDSNPPEKTP